jgi:hypothetical protein
MGKCGKMLRNQQHDKIPAAKYAGKQKSTKATLEANANSVKAMQSE